MKVLISGGAGFVGSTIASACIDDDIEVVILDDLSSGRREFVGDRPFLHGDIADDRVVDRAFAEHPQIAAVVHCAAQIVVPESVTDPIRYYRANVSKSIDFIASLLRNGCTRLLFSSTAALYEPRGDFSVDEDSPINPKSPYARTKAVFETVLRDVVAATKLRAISMRYFNLVGADPRLRTGLQTPHPTHLLGRVIEADQHGVSLPITGTDWATRDGTGIRDYIHVWDLAGAHVAALRDFDRLLPPGSGGLEVINLGTGTGTTVRELVAAYEEVTGHTIATTVAERRQGDVAGAYTRNDKAKALLGWTPAYKLTDGIRAALAWSEIRAKVLSGP